MEIIIIIIGIQPLGRSGQRPELSQATGMALVRCILGKFLGVVCHCFPPHLDVPTFATRCLHVVTKREILAAEGCGWECCPVILPKWRLPHHLGIFYMPQIYDMGPTALPPLRRKACWGFFRPEKVEEDMKVKGIRNWQTVARKWKEWRKILLEAKVQDRM